MSGVVLGCVRLSAACGKLMRQRHRHREYTKEAAMAKLAASEVSLGVARCCHVLIRTCHPSVQQGRNVLRAPVAAGARRLRLRLGLPRRATLS